jgi:ribonuclease P protein component
MRPRSDGWRMARATQAGGSTSRVITLKRRSDYLRVRKGARCATAAFVLEAKARGPACAAPADGPRFGFTVTRHIGKAVERNRMRRRLKAAVRDAAPNHAKREFDYVLIARRAALTSQFAALVGELARALARVHRVPKRVR